MSTDITLAKTDSNNNISNSNTINNAITKKPPSFSKKGGRAMNILRVALYMLRKKRNKSSGGKSIVANTALKRLMGSVRPLNYIQDGVGGGMSPPQSPPPPPPPPPAEAPIEVASPLHGHSSSSSSTSFLSYSSASSEGMSRYESALSLYDLDNHDDDDEEEDEDAYYDGLQGDDMIDAKAEMFIAKFYQQMKIQG